ncbi:TPA: hypothetical protein EYP38_01010 [Candidatus Micrarchaeota archaeon]|nr:hypothetical protein [Candidatus Micrarchaeota archaeon]
MQSVKTTRMQRAKEILTKPITMKGMLSAVTRLFKRKAEPESIRRTPSVPPARNVDSGLWDLQQTREERREHLGKMKAHALELRKRATELRGSHDFGWKSYEADMLDLNVASTYIRMGWVQEAALIGFEFQQRGDFMNAANIYSASGSEDAFFRLIEQVHNVGNHQLAVDIVRMNAGLRGVVKYNEAYKKPHGELVESFSDSEILDYSRQMMAQKKKHHVFQLGEVCENAERHDLAVKLYSMVGIYGGVVRCERARMQKQALEHLRNGEFLEAGKLILRSSNSKGRAEAREIAEAASLSFRFSEAAELYGLLGDREARIDSMHLQALDLLMQAEDHHMGGNRFGAINAARREEVYTAGIMLYDEKRFQEAYEIADRLRELGTLLNNRTLVQRAASIYRRTSVTHIGSQAAA